MKANLILTMSVFIAFGAQAKLNDFNDLIVANSEAQKVLHEDLKAKVRDTEIAANIQKQDRVIVDSTDTYNIPTQKSFVTYKKDSIDFKPVNQQAQKRLAQEVDSAE